MRLVLIALLTGLASSVAAQAPAGAEQGALPAPDVVAVPAVAEAPVIRDFQVKRIDAEGPWLWWELAPGIGGRVVVLRAAEGAIVPDRVSFDRMEPGPVVGHPEWTAVATIAPTHRGLRDVRPAPGTYVYALAVVTHVATGENEREGVWQSVELSKPATARVLPALMEPTKVEVKGENNDNGTHLTVTWEAGSDDPSVGFVVLRSRGTADAPAAELGEGAQWTKGWEAAHADPLDHRARELKDTVEDPGPWRYAVVAVRQNAEGKILDMRVSRLSDPVAPVADWFNETRWATLAVILLMALALFYYIPKVRKDPESVFIRRIPGVEAIEDADGRSPEMGRPVLYVTGIENIQNIQTIASLLCLGPVAEMTAEYDTELKVANFEALTMVVAEEIVKQGYANAGRADAHRPENCLFISSEQFAFAAGVNGIILRDKPATNIYLGRFFAESLILAETGYVTKSIQIAGTAEVTQLPFFIAACDYTIIGEELYAVSAYLSRDPKLLATLKASDAVKLAVIITIVVGAVLAALGIYDIGPGIAQ